MALLARACHVLTLAALLAGSALLSAAAQTAPPPVAGAPVPSGPLTYDQFKAWQMQRMTQARAAIDQRLAAPGITDNQRQRLQRIKSQLDRFASLSPEQQDKRLRRRFARLDTNHNGLVEPAEIQAGQHRDRLQGLTGN